MGDSVMNLGEIKAFLGERKQPVGRSELLREAEPATEQLSNTQQSSSVLLLNNSEKKRVVSLKVFVGALNQSLQIGDRQVRLSEPKKENAGLFDFEEVAKNVLHFVGGAIKHAQAKGMDEEKLKGLFAQAREGVLKGVKMAEKELGGLMNEEISSGIRKSQELIEKGIQALEQDIFAPSQASEPVSGLQTSNQLDYRREDQGELSIRTKDGDEVRIRLEDFRQFQLSQSLFTVVQRQQQQQDASPGKVEDTAQTATQNAELTSSDANNQPAPSTSNSRMEQNAIFVQEKSVSFSVSGQLDEQELKAIGKLVGDAANLVDEFFNGDVEAAFNQALKLGFDEKELTGFALQLSRQEQVKVIQTYEQVSHFQEGAKRIDPASQVRPVAEYLQHMVDLLESSRRQLEDVSIYENLVNGLINKGLKIEVPDLIEAINRFHGFNQKLLDNLPANVANQPQDDSNSEI